MSEPVQDTSASGAQRRAPLRNNDLPAGSIVPNQYLVYSKPGYTLEDHKRTVGEAALPEGSIKQVRNLATDQYGVYYTAHLNESSLDTIRLDPGVQLVECNLIVYLIDRCSSRSLIRGCRCS